jgi:hypothetical protein
MSDNTLKYPRGTCLVFTSGEYSDFGMRGILVTIKDCDLPALAQLYAKTERNKAIKAKAPWFDVQMVDFPSWLVAKGHAMPADAQTVHLGSYSKFEPEFGVPDSMYDIDDEVG